MAVIETKNLTLTYGVGTPFERTALKNCSVSIEQGDYVAVIGHTGSGKSTLVQLLNGLLKPSSGKVLLDGRDIWAKPKEIKKVRFKVGMVFQFPEYQLFAETVREDIAYGPTNQGYNDNEIKAIVEDTAKLVGITHLLDKSPFDLSGGEKRRAAIAGVMAMAPKVLILDEPTAGLDPMGREAILDLVDKYRSETGATIILVSHSMEDVAARAEKVIVLNEGELKMQGSVREVFSHAEELSEMGLKIPQITQVFMELRKLGFFAESAVFSVEEGVREALRLLGKGGAADD